MAKSFKDMSDDTQATAHFRIVELEKGRTVKRTFNKNNSFIDTDLAEMELLEICQGFNDLPF